MRMMWQHILWLRKRIQEQKAWIEKHGGDLAGYIAHYGDPGVPPIDPKTGKPMQVFVKNADEPFIDGYLDPVDKRDFAMPGLTGNMYYARHFGDGGTAIYRADKDRLEIWESELSELRISCFAAWQKADEQEKSGFKVS